MLTELFPARVPRHPTATVFYMSSRGHAGTTSSQSGLSPSSRPSSPSILSAAEQALLVSSDADSDDGVAIVMNMLDTERPTVAPVQNSHADTLELDRLLAGWGAAEWGCGKRHQKQQKNSTQTSDECQPRDCITWTHSEDCVVADVMSGVDPQKQRDEIKRRLPGRRWSQVYERFRQICGEVLPKCESEQDDAPEHAKWTRRKRWGSARAAEAKFKPSCPIVKRLTRWR